MYNTYVLYMYVETVVLYVQYVLYAAFTVEVHRQRPWYQRTCISYPTYQLGVNASVVNLAVFRIRYNVHARGFRQGTTEVITKYVCTN